MYNDYGDNMKKIISIIIVLLSFLFTNVYAEEYKYVLDDGNILKDSTEKYINDYSEYLDKEANIEYYVVTIDNLGEYDLDTYSKIVYSNFVHNKKDRGLLILVSRNDRQVEVVSGKGLSGVITDEVINDYISDYFMTFFANNEWDTGVKNGYTAFFKYICLHLNIDTSGLELYYGNDFLFKYRYYILFICIWICNVIGYVLPKYFIRLFNKNYKITFKDNLVLYSSVFFNVIILYYNYIINSKFLLIILAFEIFSILSGTIFNTSNVRKKRINTKQKYRKINSRSFKINK